MSYIKQTWADGDVITASKLNHMENGIANAGSGGGVSTGTWFASTSNFSSHTIFAETISQDFALQDGSAILLQINEELSGEYLYLVIDSNDYKQISKTSGSLTPATSGDIMQGHIYLMTYDGDYYVLADAVATIPQATNSSFGGVKVIDDSTNDIIEIGYANGSLVTMPRLVNYSDTIGSKFLPNATSATKGAVIVDSALSTSSANPVQNSAVSTAIGNIRQLPTVSSSDNGKGLVVDNGAWSVGKVGDAKNIWYATCSDSGSTLAATTTSGDFVLQTGNTVIVKFSHTASTSPSSSMTLNIDGTGAKNIVVKKKLLSSSLEQGFIFTQDQAVQFVYDGTYFVVVDCTQGTKSMMTSIAAGNTSTTIAFYASKDAPFFSLTGWKYLSKAVYQNFNDFYYTCNVPYNVSKGNLVTITITLNEAQSSDISFVLQGDVSNCNIM